MQRQVVSFYQDEQGHWAAMLECGHGQHIRHDPPWTRAGVGGDRRGKSGADWELDGVQAVRRGARIAAGSRILTIPSSSFEKERKIIWMRC
jgi:hypothetical protein